MNKNFQLKVCELLKELSEMRQIEAAERAKQQQKPLGAHKSQLKKFKKRFLLFQAPFFELPPGHEYRRGPTVIARCRTCGALMRGNRTILSVFIKHMKDNHPDKYEMYEQWRNTQINNVQPSTSQAANNNNDHLIKEEIQSVDESEQTDETQSSTSEISLSESTTKLIHDLLDEKLTPLLHREQQESYQDFKAEIQNLKQEIKQLREQLKNSEEDKKLLRQELECLEREMQQNNIIVRDLPFDETKDNTRDTINCLFTNILGLKNMNFEKVVVLPKSGSTERNKRTMIVTFREHVSAELVLSQTSKLRFTGIFIEPCITQSALRRRLKMLKLRREIMKHKPFAKAIVCGTTLCVAGYRFEWSILNDLTVTGNNVASKSAADYLQEATGLDLKDFLKSLKK